MNKKKYLALFLCALFLSNAALGGLLAEGGETSGQPLTTLEETLPSENVTPEQLPQATEELQAEITPAPEPEQVPDQTEEPPPEMTPEPDPDLTEEPPPEVTPEPVSDQTEEPLPEVMPEVMPEPEPDPTEEAQPEISPEPFLETTEESLPSPTEGLVQEPSSDASVFVEEIPQIERKASKKLIAFASAKSIEGERAVSSLIMGVDADIYYINLNDGIQEITWTIQTDGGTGPLQYAFDVYKDGVCISYMPAYVSGDTYSYTPTEPGRYSAKAFVYEWDTATERTEWSWDTGVSALSLDRLTVTPDNPVVGDQLTWTVDTTGGTGAIQYLYSIYLYDGFNYDHLKSSGYISSNSYSYRVSLPGIYYMEMLVWEEDITGHDLVLSSETEVSGESTLIINGVSSDKTNADINERITWTVSASGAVGTVEYEFHVYAGNIRIESSRWSTDNSHVFRAERNGYYNVEVFIRDSAFPDKLYTVKSDIVSVPGFDINSLSVDKTAAYVGDSVTWTVDFSGNGDRYYTDAWIYLDGSDYDYTYEWKSNTISYLFTEPGNYRIDIYLDVPYNYILCGSTNLTVRERPAPLNVVTAAVSATSIKVSWNAVTGATGYELSVSTSKTGTYTPVYTGTARAFTHTKRAAGTIYYYKVRAYKEVGGEQYFGAFSLAKPAVALAKPATPSASSTSSKTAKITWTSVKGASGYELWRSTSPSGAYTRVYRGTAKTFTNKGLTSGKTYYYKVKVYKLAGSVSLYSPFSAYRAVKSK